MAANIAIWESHAWVSWRLHAGGQSANSAYINVAAELGRRAWVCPRYAVYVSATRFDTLSDGTTARWLVASSPDERQMARALMGSVYGRHCALYRDAGEFLGRAVR